jgi:hypothetical protein
MFPVSRSCVRSVPQTLPRTFPSIKYNIDFKRFATYSKGDSPREFHTGKLIILGGAVTLALGYLFKEDDPIIEASYREGNELKIPTYLKRSEWRPLIDEMVELGDVKALKKFVELFQAGKYFSSHYDDHVWENDMAEAILKKRDPKLVKEIFPLFSIINANRINRSSWYCKPIIGGDLELIKAMIDAKIPLSKDVNYTFVPPYGDHLLLAMANKQYDVVELLLHHYGHDVYNTYPFSLNRMEIKEGRAEFNYIYSMVDEEWKISPAFLALFMDDAKLSKIFAAYHIDVEKGFNCIDNLRWLTPLMKAIQEETKELVHILLEKKVNPNFQIFPGKSALHTAIRKGNSHIIRELLAFGADPTIRGEHQNTLWHTAFCGSAPHVSCNILKEVIPELIDEPNEKGSTPLMTAIEGYDVDGVKLLLEHGASATKAALEFARKTLLELNNHLQTIEPQWKGTLESLYTKRISRTNNIIKMLEGKQ